MKKTIIYIFITITICLTLKSSSVYADNQLINISLNSRFNYRNYKNMTNLSDESLLFENKTGKTLTEMKISDTGLFDNMNWEQYSPMKRWKFSSPDGQKPVYAQFKTIDGEIIPSAATFIYDTTPPQITFALDTKLVGPNIINFTADVEGSDKWSIMNYEYRIGFDQSFITSSVWYMHESNKITRPIENFSSYKDGDIITVYFQTRDIMNNTSKILTDTFIIDKTPPVIYVKINPSDSLSQEVQVLAYDEHSYLNKIQITNDPRFIDNVQVMPYQEKIFWHFDERRVVWIKLSDNVGNITESYPAFLAPITSPSFLPSWTPTPSANYPSPSINPTVASDPKFIEFQKKIEMLEKRQEAQDKSTNKIQENVKKQEKRLSLIESIIHSITSLLKSVFPFWK